jgi:hypothetical protein
MQPVDLNCNKSPILNTELKTIIRVVFLHNMIKQSGILFQNFERQNQIKQNCCVKNLRWSQCFH